MTELERLLIRLEADTELLRRQMRKNEQTISKSTGRMEKAIGRFKDRAIDSFKGMGAALIAALGARELIRAADTAQLIENRLRLVTDSTAELTEAQERLFHIAQESRSSFEATVNLYGRLARSSQELGLTQDRLLRVTETINQAVKISGATTAEASQGLIQFSQGLASGALRGDELRSVLEQMPRLARAIADGMGKTVGELRALGTAGRLNATTVIEALESQADVIREEFEETEGTVADAVEEMGNSLVRFIGKLDEASGASDIFAGALQTVARGIDAVTDATTQTPDELNIPFNAEDAMALRDELEHLQEFVRNFNFAILPPEAFAAAKRRIEQIKQEMEMGIHLMPEFDPAGSRGVMDALDEVEVRVKRIKAAAADTAASMSLADFGFHGREILEGPKIKLEVLPITQKQLQEQMGQMGFTADRMLELPVAPKIELESLQAEADRMANVFEALGESVGDSLESNLAAAMRGIKVEWDDLIEDMIARAAASNLLNLLGSIGAPSGTFNALGKFLGLGKRAAGGPVMQGQPVIVGERRPEIFIPNTAGRVESRVPAGRGDLIVNVDARGATDPALVEAAAQRAVVAAVQIADARSSAKIASLRRPSIS